jgi:hypothetical protein
MLPSNTVASPRCVTCSSPHVHACGAFCQLRHATLTVCLYETAPIAPWLVTTQTQDTYTQAHHMLWHTDAQLWHHLLGLHQLLWRPKPIAEL